MEQATTTTTATTSPKPPHILLYPFPTSGHTIPFLHFTHHLLTNHQNLTITVLLVPSTSTLLTPLLPLFPTTLHTLQLLHPPTPTPTPDHKQDIFSIMFSLQTLNPQIISWFNSHPSPPDSIISDFFLGFTTSLANQLGIKRFVFSTSGALALNLMNSLYLNRPPFTKFNHSFSFPHLPGHPLFQSFQLSKLYPEMDPDDQEWNDFIGFWSENMASHGVVVNTLTELESVHLTHLKSQLGHDRVFAVGPLASVVENNEMLPFHDLMTWLEGKADDSVVYVCFGSRTILTRQQLDSISIGMDRSGVNFVLCVDRLIDLLEEGYENRVAGRGFVLRGWAPQVTILNHRAVGSFVTHCGWNSVLEGVSAGVVMLTWPMGAEQFVNAKLVVDELGVGMRVGGSSERVPDGDEVARVVIEAVSGGGKEREKALRLREVALTAVNVGSSKVEWNKLVSLLSEK